MHIFIFYNFLVETNFLSFTINLLESIFNNCKP